MSTSTTAIEWTDRTWNPVTGCTKVSPGCDHCYAETIANRFAGAKAFPKGFDVTLRVDRLSDPMSWRKPAKVFVNSMSDLFHQDIPDAFIAKVFGVMALTPQHTYQVLTKRHARMRSLLNNEAFQLAVLAETARQQDEKHPMPAWHPGTRQLKAWPLPNVWLGVSAENQKWAETRIPALLQTPAAVRFVSAEPLVGPIDLRNLKARNGALIDALLGNVSTPDGEIYASCPSVLDWVIVGGESGHGARAMHPGWARLLRDQCAGAPAAFLFKQWGEWGPAPFIVRVCDPQVGWLGTEEELAEAKRQSEAAGATHAHTGNWYEEDGERKYWLHEIGHKPWSLERVALPPESAAIRRWGKKAAGRELDGRTWDEFPGGAE